MVDIPPQMQSPAGGLTASSSAEVSISSSRQTASMQQMPSSGTGNSDIWQLLLTTSVAQETNASSLASGHSSIESYISYPKDSDAQKRYDGEVADQQFAQGADGAVAGKTPFLDQTAFLSSQDLMSGEVDLSHLTTCFSTTAQGQIFRAKHQPVGVVVDPTVPTTDRVRAAHVAVLVQAFKSVALAVDNTNAKAAFLQERHDNRLVEAVLWEVLDELITRSTMAGSYQNVYGVTPRKSDATYSNFAHRFDEVVKTLATKKSICKGLLDPSPAIKLVDDPTGRRSKSLENQVTNQSKQRKLNELKNIKKDHGIGDGEDEDEDEDSPRPRKRRRALTSQTTTDTAISSAYATPDILPTNMNSTDLADDDPEDLFGSVYPREAYDELRNLLTEAAPDEDHSGEENQNEPVAATPDIDPVHNANITEADSGMIGDDTEQGQGQAGTPTSNIWQGYSIEDLFSGITEEDETVD